MSIKRSKPTQRGKNRDVDMNSPIFGARSSEPKWSWREHVSAEPDDVFVTYDMEKTFAKKALITHPTFGKGLVISVDGARIEVLFEDAARKLAHAGV